jgi:hypothetical protein
MKQMIAALSAQLLPTAPMTKQTPAMVRQYAKQMVPAGIPVRFVLLASVFPLLNYAMTVKTMPIVLIFSQISRCV